MGDENLNSDVYEMEEPIHLHIGFEKTELMLNLVHVGRRNLVSGAVTAIPSVR